MTVSLRNPHTIGVALVTLALAWRAIVWYVPSGASRPADFVPGNLRWQLDSILVGGPVDATPRIRGDTTGQHLTLWGGYRQFWYSQDAGVHWEPAGQVLGPHHDFAIEEGTGRFHLVDTWYVAAPPQPTYYAAIGHRTAEMDEPAIIYQAGVGVPSSWDMRHPILTYQAGKLWLLIQQNDASGGQYHLDMLTSSDGIEWHKLGRVDGLQDPRTMWSAPSLTVHPDGTITVATLDWVTDDSLSRMLKLRRSRLTKSRTGRQLLRGASRLYNHPLVVVQRNVRTGQWLTLAADLGRGGAPQGFRNLAANDPYVFSNPDGSVGILWRQTLTRVNSETFWTPVDIFKFVPIVNWFVFVGMFQGTDRDDICFALCPRGELKCSAPRRINDVPLTHRSETHFGESGVRQMQRVLAETAEHGVSLRAAASSSGRYVAAAWHDYRKPGKRPIYCSYSLDGGKHWSQNQVVLPHVSNAAPFDLFFAEDGTLHLVFTAKETGTLYHAVAAVSSN